MAEVNTFVFKNYDKGGYGAVKGDGKLTGEEIGMAAKDGWTVWDGFKSQDKAMRTDDAVDKLFADARANNNPTLVDKRKDADENYLSWAMGRFDTENVSEVITNGDTTILKETYETAIENGSKIKWVNVTDTYIIKNNNDGTTEITRQSWMGETSRTLIDNRAGKEILDVDFLGGEYTQKDRTTGKKSRNKLGDFVKNLMSNSSREIKRVPNSLIDGKRFESIDITF